MSRDRGTWGVVKGWEWLDGRRPKHLARLGGCHGDAASLSCEWPAPRIASTCHMSREDEQAGEQSVNQWLVCIAFIRISRVPPSAMLLILASLPCTMHEAHETSHP